MPFIQITRERKDEYNNVVSHPLQSYEWGEFREKTGIKVIRRGYETNGKLTSGFQLTIHSIPKVPFTIGYLPKGTMPTKQLIDELQKIGKEEKCIFVQLEPNVIKSQDSRVMNQDLEKFEAIIHNSRFTIQPSAHPLFTKYTFTLDLTNSEEDLLKNTHSKTRYNIRLAEKRGVHVALDDSKIAFERYWELTQETTTRQKFYAHTKKYHQMMWHTLHQEKETNKDSLTAHLLTGTYEKKILTTWILFVFHDTLYYPYGASSTEHKEVMANNLIMWEAIKLGKKLGLKKFDMWGALGSDPNPNDPWYGFHRFKSGYGPEHIEFVGSYDLIVDPLLYQGYKIADKLRWLYLRMKKH